MTGNLKCHSTRRLPSQVKLELPEADFEPRLKLVRHQLELEIVGQSN